MYDVIIVGAGPAGVMRRECEVVGVAQDELGVTVELADGTQLHSRFLVGSDGGRSTVRKLLGVGFPGEPSRHEMLLGVVELAMPADEIDRIVTRFVRPTRTSARGRSATDCTAPSRPPMEWPKTAQPRRSWRSSVMIEPRSAWANDIGRRYRDSID